MNQNPIESSELRKIIREELSQLLLMNKEVLNVFEAAAYLNLTPDYVRKLCKTNEIRNHKPSGKVIFIHRTDLVNYAMGKTEETIGEASRLASTYILKHKLKQ